MVAIVTGGGLGLNTSSGALLGARGVLGDAQLGRSNDRVYVNGTTGNLVIQTQDILLDSRGVDDTVSRTYNSLGRLADDNGDNWMLGTERRILGLSGAANTPGSSVTRRDADGAEFEFTWDDARAAYVSTDGDGAYSTLRYDADTQQWAYTNGSSRVVETYDGSQGGRLVGISDPDGNTISLTYDAATGLIASATDASGEVTCYDYNGARQLTQVRTAYRSSESAPGNDVTLTRVRYAYDASGRLSQVIVDLTPEDSNIADGDTFTTTYTYDGGSHRVASITEGDGTTVSFTYTGEKVATITDGLGRVTRMDYGSSGADASGASIDPTTVAADASVLSTTETQPSTQTYALDDSAAVASAPVPPDALIPGTVRSGLSAAQGQMLVYRIEVPAGAPVLHVQTDGGTGDADLVLSYGHPPAADGADYHSWDSGLSNESIVVDQPAAGTWYVGVNAYTQIDGVSLAAYVDQSADGAVLQPGVAITGIHAGADPEGANDLFYRFDVPAGASDVRIVAKGLFGDADLYVNENAPADVNHSDFVDCSENSGCDEVIQLGARESATSWYIQVRPYTDVSDLSLVAYCNLGDSNPPLANAGDDQYVGAGSAVTLNASASADNGVATVAWMQVSGPAVTLDGADTLTPSFEALSVPGLSTLSFQVTVTDTQGLVRTDTVEVAVFPVSRSYTVQAGDTWSTIAQALYGSAQAGDALAQALGEPALAEGSSLQDLPEQLSVQSTSPTTVAAYYTVQPGDTWTTITQTIYGTTDPGALQALQQALGSPSLDAGIHLSVPPTLDYSAASDNDHLPAPSEGASGPSTMVTDALGNVTRLDYDDLGRLTRLTAPPAAAQASPQVVEFAYSSNGDLTSVTDGNGLTTAYKYDANGNQILRRDAAGNTVLRSFGERNELLEETTYAVPDADGAGPAGPAGAATTRYAYDETNHLRFEVSSEGRVTEHQYDAFGQQTAIIQYDGDFYPSTQAVSDAALTEWRSTDGRQVRATRQEFGYDWRGNLVHQIQSESLRADGRVDSQFSSDATGESSVSERWFVYDPSGQLLSWRESADAASERDLHLRRHGARSD